ncbi:MgtE integral membrane region [Halodesulfurarchaeum formicicum]|uniref:MgtE integral membrane region n=2 Tax=Halodesulfurarchaeum formicicum TaxID=1873524 RepID=A0A1D8S767_9EURY|nr:MgtE integral membrane region [Halodesulfurarchaeum formicicum]
MPGANVVPTMTVASLARAAYREALGPLLVAAVGGLFAGLVLTGMEADLERTRGLLVLVPALLATRGNVFGAFAARIASGLHQGLVGPKLRVDDERLQAATAAASSNNLLASGFAAVLTVLAMLALGQGVAPLWELLAIALIAAFLSGLALAAVVIGVMFLGFRRGIDPDTLVGPLVTTTGDVIGIAFLLLAVRIVVGGV